MRLIHIWCDPMNQTISIGKFPIEINHLKILCHFFESNKPKRLLSSSVRICNFVKVDRSPVWLGSGPESRLQERAYCSMTCLMKSSFTAKKSIYVYSLHPHVFEISARRRYAAHLTIFPYPIRHSLYVWREKMESSIHRKAKKFVDQCDNWLRVS